LKGNNLATFQQEAELEFRTLMAGVGTAVVIAVICLALFIPWSKTATFVEFDGRPFSDLGVDVTSQRWAHQIGISVLTVLGLAVLLCPKRRATHPARTIGPLSYLFLFLGTAGVALFSVWWTRALPLTTTITSFGEVFGALASPSRSFVLMAALFALVLVPSIAVAQPKLHRTILWCLAIAYATVLLGGGFFGPIRLDRIAPEHLVSVESHFDAIIGAKHTLASGLQDRDFGYSFLFNLAQASWERFAGRLSFEMDIRLLQAGNVAFVLATMWAGYLWNPTRPLIGILALVLVLPWVHNDFIAILHPNQAGWRYIAFPAAVIVMRLASGKPPHTVGRWFGLFGAFAVLWNAETGTAVVIGLLVRMAAGMKTISVQELLVILMNFLVGIIFGIVCIAVLYRLGLGRWPDMAGFVLDFLHRTQGLSRGRAVYLDPLAVLVAAYALWYVLRALAIRRLGPVASKPADRAALGAMILAWGAYYIQQPHPWNIWSYMFPLGLLLGDTLFSARWPRNWTQATVRVAVPVVTFAFIVAPAIAAGNYQAVRSVWRGFAIRNTPSSEVVLISGVGLPRSATSSLKQRLEYMSKLPQNSWIFTGNVYLLPRLSDRQDVTISRSLYWKATLPQFTQLVDQVRSSAPPALVFDDPESLSKGGFTQRYLAELQKALADSYYHKTMISGWSIWLRRCQQTREGNMESGKASVCQEGTQ
jgi:hypothetical protein